MPAKMVVVYFFFRDLLPQKIVPCLGWSYNDLCMLTSNKCHWVWLAVEKHNSFWTHGIRHVFFGRSFGL